MKSHYAFRIKFSSLLAVFFLLAQSFIPGLAAPYPAARRAVLIDVPFFSQVTFKGAVDDNNQPLLLGNSKDILLWTDGCGVASLAMVYQKWGMATCLPCLNEALKKSKGFSGALLRFDDPMLVAAAGDPFIKSIRSIPTSNPNKYKQEVDRELTAGRPVIAFINRAHFVVITGIDESGGYLVNDPWKRNEAEGKNIPIKENLTGLGFDRITQFEFISPSENAPTNGVVVRGAIRDAYFAGGGSQGVLGNPVSEDTEDTMFMDRYHWQKFENGVMVEIDGEVRSIDGVLWRKVLELGGLENTGLPLNSQYFYGAGEEVVQTVDLERMTLKWGDKSPENRVEILYPGQAIRVEYYPNGNLSGQPIHTSLTKRIQANWGNSRPVPWLNPDQFSVRWKGEITQSIGWFYTFRVNGEGRYRVYLDGKLMLDAWDHAAGEKFTKFISRGTHTFSLEYAKSGNNAGMSFVWSAWPAISLVFAAEDADGPVDYLPASITDYLGEPSVEEIVFPNPEDPVHELMGAIAARDVDRALQAVDPADQAAGRLLILGLQEATDLSNTSGRVEFGEVDYSVTAAGQDQATVLMDGIADFYNAADELVDSRYFNLEIPVIKKDGNWYISLDLRKAYELLKQYQESQ